MRNLFRFSLLALWALALCLPVTATAGPPGATAVVLLPSAARTADTEVNFVNRFIGQCGVIFVLDVTLDPAAATVALLVKMLELDGVTALPVNILNTAAVDAVGTTFHRMGSGGFTTGDLSMTSVSGNALPSHWQLFMNHSNADSMTYSVTAYFLPCL